MPLLDKDGLVSLRQKPRRVCAECNNTTFENYCRSCDEFFWDGHVHLANLMDGQTEIKGVGIHVYTCSCASIHQREAHRSYRLQITEPWRYGDAVNHVQEVEDAKAARTAKGREEG